MPSVAGFINTDLIRFSQYDNERSLPHLFDGLKVCQRKIIHTAILQKNGFRIKTNQLGTKSAEETHYHHGEDSIINAVVGLGRDLPGSNNVPLLLKDGQFGNRLSREASSPRYISVLLGEKTRDLFTAEDDAILEYEEEEGDKIEPKFFCPPVPMLLVNGARGTGTGFGTKILTHAYKDVARAVVECVTTGKVQTRLVPHFNGFHGTVTRAHDDQIFITGAYEIVNANTIRITALPLKYQQDAYKKILNDLVDKKVIKSYTNRSKAAAWDFEIKVPREVTKLSKERIIKTFKLQEKFTQTFVAWSLNGEKVPRQFSTPEEVVETFVDQRRKFYDDRKQSLLAAELKLIEWIQLRQDFIKWWNGDKTVKTSKKAIGDAFLSVCERTCSDDDLDRLLNMPIYSLTSARIDKLEDELEERNNKWREINESTAEGMWSTHIQAAL